MHGTRMPRYIAAQHGVDTRPLRIRTLTAATSISAALRLRLSCCRVYPVTPPSLYPAQASCRRPLRPVLPRPVLASLPRRPCRLAAAPGRCRTGHAGPLPCLPPRAAGVAARRACRTCRAGHRAGPAAAPAAPRRCRRAPPRRPRPLHRCVSLQRRLLPYSLRRRTQHRCRMYLH
jgi:hypothetical protein